MVCNDICACIALVLTAMKSEKKLRKTMGATVLQTQANWSRSTRKVYSAIVAVLREGILQEHKAFSRGIFYKACFTDKRFLLQDILQAYFKNKFQISIPLPWSFDGMHNIASCTCPCDVCVQLRTSCLFTCDVFVQLGTSCSCTCDVCVQSITSCPCAALLHVDV